jgi:membrane protein required for colicin V production
VALFIATLIVGGMINFIVTKLIKKTGLSGTDRFFGMFFGALRGLIAIVAITFFIQATPLSEDPWWQQSKLAPHFSKISEWVRQNMPNEFSNYFSFVENNKEIELQKLIDSLSNNNNSNRQDNNIDLDQVEEQ